MTQLEEIIDIAYRFRFAIEAAVASGEFLTSSLPRLYNAFPNGCEDLASNILGTYFYKNGFNVVKVTGKHENCKHTWLIVENYIVDITGDQYNERKSCHYYDKVVCVDEESEFHLMFEIVSKTDFLWVDELSEENDTNNILGQYDVVIRYMSES